MTPMTATRTAQPDADERTLHLARKKGAKSDKSEKKTPVPQPAIGESAVARSQSENSGSGPRKPGSTMSRDREGLRIIAQISRVLPSVEDESEFLDYSLGKVLEVVHAERGILMRLDPSRKGLYPASVRNALPGRDDKAARRQGVSHTVCKKVIRERVSVLVDDAKIDPRFKEASSIQDLEVRSILCAPIWLGEEVSGLIYLDHLMHAYMFTEADRELVVAVANLVALGIQKNRKK
jgi:3',5'-cyclic-nucleotide phosphodiesterase